MKKATLQVDIVSPEEILFSETADMVVVPGSEGDMGLLVDHSPVISLVRPGVIEIHKGDKLNKSFFIAGGFVEISDNHCTILAEEAHNLKELTKKKAQERLAEAERHLKKSASESEKSKNEAELAVAQAMVEAAA